MTPVNIAYEQSQCRWPGVVLAFERFEQHWQSIAQKDATAPERTAEVFLCCACLAHDPIALSLFEKEFVQPLRRWIARVDHREEFVAETVQLLRTKMLVGDQPRLASFRAQGPLGAWLRVAASRLALDQCRGAATREQRERALEAPARAQRDPEYRTLQIRYQPLIEAALDQAIRSLSPRDRQVLKMHTAGCCNFEQIAKAYSVNRSTVMRWVERCRSQVRGQVRAELCERLGNVSEQELNSLLAELETQLNVHLSQLFTRSDLQIKATT